MTNSSTVDAAGPLHRRILDLEAQITQLRADISQAYDLRDKAEGRYCTALGEIEVLRGNLSLAEEGLASYALEVEQLTGERAQDQQRLFHYEGAIERLTSERDEARRDCLNFKMHGNIAGHTHEPCEQRPAELAWGLESKLPGGDWKVYWALYSDRDRAEQSAKNGRPEGTEWRVVTYARLPDGASRGAPCTFPACGHRDVTECGLSQGASRDASSEPSERHVDWEAEYKKLAGVYTREGLEKFIADHWPGNVLADATESKSGAGE